MSKLNQISYRAQLPSLFQRELRKLAAIIIQKGTEKGDLKIFSLLSSFAKRIRTLINNPYKSSVMDLLKTIKLNSTIYHFDADIILTHDVDWKVCWECHEKIADWEEELGVRSIFCYLTNGPYKISHSKLDDMELRGFEIGLHGEWHDVALGYRTKKEIKNFLNRSVTELRRNPVLFRSPALSVSETLFEVLHETEIHRDSSIPVWSQYYPACGYPGPYQYPGLDVIEYPLALQDDFLFRDLALTDEVALQFSISLLNLFQLHKGVFVLNTHPGIVIKHEKFYKSFIEYCIKNNFKIKTMTSLS